MNINIDENQQGSIFNGEYSIMISSSVGGYEDQLDILFSYFTQLGYKVIMSKAGTIKADPRVSNFENCLRAVDECDLFLGIIRQNCGTGKGKGDSITFQEFKRAREKGKPCWYVIESNITNSKNLLRALQLVRHSHTKSSIFNGLFSLGYWWMYHKEMKMPTVMQLFRPSRRDYFDEECFDMQDFVNQLNVPIEQRVNNWMHYYRTWAEMHEFLKTNFEDRPFIEKVLMENKTV